MEINKDDTLLFDNYTNYLYKIEDYRDIIKINEEVYILFNPAIHYWVLLDKNGVAIYNEIRNYNSLCKVKENLKEKFAIDEQIFIEEVKPFIDELVKNGFLSLEVTENEANWMNTDIDIDPIEKYPFSDLYINLTEKCNLNCVYCFNKKERQSRMFKKIDNFLAKEKIIEVIKEFKSLGGKNVIFTGGEPTLNKDLITICCETKKVGLNPHFLTNGTQLHTVDIKKLAQCVDSFTISLDSIIEEELNILWQNENRDLLNNLFQALQKIDEFSLNNKTLKIYIKPTITKINSKSIPDLVSVISKKLANCEVIWAMTKYNKINDLQIDNELNITEEEYFNCVIKSLKVYYFNKIDKGNENEILQKINLYSLSHSGRLLPPDSPNLLSCNPSFFISNNGDVYPCQCFDNNKYKLGNIQESSLKELYNIDIFKKIREKLPINKIADKVCLRCELRFLCSNKLGPCAFNNDKDLNSCKQINILKMYLQTIT